MNAKSQHFNYLMRKKNQLHDFLEAVQAQECVLCKEEIELSLKRVTSEINELLQSTNGVLV